MTNTGDPSVSVHGDDRVRILRSESDRPAIIAETQSGILVRATPQIKSSWEDQQMGRFSLASATKFPRTFVRAFTVAICLLTAHQPVNAMGCIEGAMLGGIAGHMKHHTFLGIFGGCLGGIYVHRLYSKWKKTHPNGSLNEFVAAHKDVLPQGWAERLGPVGETRELRPH